MSLICEIIIRRDNSNEPLLRFKNNAFMSMRWIAAHGESIIDDDMKSALTGFIFMPYSNKDMTTVLEEIKEQIEIQIVQQKHRLISL